MENIDFFSLLDKPSEHEDVQHVIRLWNLTRLEPEDEDDELFFESKQSGVQISFNEDERLECVFLYSRAYEGFSDFQGSLPLGVSLDWSREKVRQVLGVPSFSFPGEKSRLLSSPPNDRYDGARGSVSISYVSDHIVMIQVFRRKE